YERHLIVNIANEPGNKVMEASVFRNTYSSAVQQMRDAGIRTPIMIDADSWGRNADSVLDNGEYLLEQDPDHNLIFSWHLWDPKNWGWGTLAEIERIITKAVSKNICFVVGEFGPCEQCDRCISTQINWEYLMEKAYKNDIGYLPWVWKWVDCHSIVNNSTGAFGSWTNAPWGKTVAVLSPYSIRKTAKRPSELAAGINDIQKEEFIVTVRPNPFSEEVEFNITLKNLTDLRLSIYDLTGKRISEIKEKGLLPGTHLVVISPQVLGTNKLTSIILYRIEVKTISGSYASTGKIVRI
ncbi:MAG TPA: hypothetical protein DCY25_10725, partial [Bacteroidales bacterium]|nr:hypothetical protein [Bacteroidales bacterium]